MHSTISFIVVALFLSTGCGKKDKAGGSAGDKAGAGGGKASGGDPSVWKPIALPKLGLIAQAPGDAELDFMGGIRAAAAGCSVNVFEKTSASEGHDNYIHNIQAGNNGGPLDQMVRDVKTDEDTYVIEYTTKTGKFGYESRRKIGSKVFSCSHVSATKVGHDCVIKVCESLAPAS